MPQSSEPGGLFVCQNLAMVTLCHIVDGCRQFAANKVRSAASSCNCSKTWNRSSSVHSMSDITHISDSVDDSNEPLCSRPLFHAHHLIFEHLIMFGLLTILLCSHGEGPDVRLMEDNNFNRRKECCKLKSDSLSQMTSSN